MRRQIRRVLILGVGSFFILLGIAGLFLPFLQGILFLFIGLLFLSRESRTAHAFLEKWRQRHPRVHAQVHELMERLKNWKGFKRFTRGHPS